MNTDDTKNNIINFEEYKNKETLNIDNIITLEQYREINVKEHLTPVEMMQIEIYNRYIQEQNELALQGVAPISSEKPAAEHIQYVTELIDKPIKTPNEEKVVTAFKERPAKTSVEPDYTRIRKKAGYIDVAVLIVVILNIGFIVAMALLKK